MDDEKMMRAALREAERGVGFTSPNPVVGAVIVRGGRIIARGWHRGAGQLHAEIEAMQALKSETAARGATLVVTLEPCSTHGRTPPCVEAIIRAGFARVVIGTTDLNPRHAGRGMDLLKGAGIAVTTGILESECTRLNRAFNRWITTGRPWVVAKAGMSLDGRLTRPPGESQWLTSEASRAHAMRLRAESDAIVIGAHTLRADNPRLTIRGLPGFEKKTQPLRVIFARDSRLPKTAHVFTDRHRDGTLVYRKQSLTSVLRELGRRQITNVLIEGGGSVLGEAFDRKLVNEVHFYVAPILCGGPDVIAGRGVGSSERAPILDDVQYERIASDLHVSGFPIYS